jgi:hypothetical protein
MSISGTDVEVWDFSESAAAVVTKTSTDHHMSGKALSEDTVGSDAKTTPSKVLYVFDRNRSTDPRLRSGFESHHKLGSFRIEDNHSYNDVNCEQNVVKSDEDLKTIEKMAVNLMDGLCPLLRPLSDSLFTHS